MRGIGTLSFLRGLVCITLTIIQVQLIYGQNHLRGTVFNDANNSCDHQSGELTYAFLPVIAHNGTDNFHTFTSGDGSYDFALPDGTYDITVTPHVDSVLGIAPCIFQSITDVILAGNVYDTIDIPVELYNSCPKVLADIVFKEIRPDSVCVASIFLFNTGSADAENTIVTLDVQDGIIIEDISFPWETDTATGLVRIEVGTVSVFRPLEIHMTGTMVSESQLEEILTVQVDPISTNECDTFAGPWDGSSLVATGTCTQSDSVEFKIKNLGLGDMQTQTDYTILQDDLLVHATGQVSLESGDSTVVVVGGQNAFYRILVDQVPNHPFLGTEEYLVETCFDSDSSLGLPGSTAIPGNDESFFIRDSKVLERNQEATLVVLPSGYCESGKVSKDSRLHFSLHARNLTQDVIADLRIAMQIPDELDPSTFRPGASTTDNYDIKSDNGTLGWIFWSAPMMPFGNEGQMDQTSVKFSIKPRQDLSYGTMVQSQFQVRLNGIWYDSNIDTLIVVTEVDSLSCPQTIVQIPTQKVRAQNVFPNPASRSVFFSNFPQVDKVEVFGLGGRLIFQKDNAIELDVSRIQNGVYILRVETSEGIIQRKLIIQH